MTGCAVGAGTGGDRVGLGVGGEAQTLGKIEVDRLQMFRSALLSLLDRASGPFSDPSMLTMAFCQRQHSGVNRTSSKQTQASSRKVLLCSSDNSVMSGQPLNRTRNCKYSFGRKRLSPSSAATIAWTQFPMGSTAGRIWVWLTATGLKAGLGVGSFVVGGNVGRFVGRSVMGLLVGLGDGGRTGAGVGGTTGRGVGR